MPEYSLEKPPGVAAIRAPWRRVRMYDVNAQGGGCTPLPGIIMFGAAYTATSERSLAAVPGGIELCAFAEDSSVPLLHVSLVSFPRTIEDMLQHAGTRVVSLFSNPQSGEQHLQLHARADGSGDSVVFVRLSRPVDFQESERELSQRNAAIVHSMALPRGSAYFYEHRGVVLRHLGAGKLRLQYPCPADGGGGVRAYETTMPSTGGDLVVHHENTDHRPRETLFSSPGGNAVLVALETPGHAVDACAPVRWAPTQAGSRMPVTFFRVPRTSMLLEFGETDGEFAEHALFAPNGTAPDYAMHIGACASLQHVVVVGADWAAPNGAVYACSADIPADAAVPSGVAPVHQMRLRVAMYTRPAAGQPYARVWAVVVPLTAEDLQQGLPSSLRVVDAVPAADGTSATLWVGTFAERMLITVSRRDNGTAVNSDGSFRGLCATPRGSDTPVATHALYAPGGHVRTVRDLRPAYRGRDVPECLLFPHPVYTDGNASTAVLGVHQGKEHGTRLLVCDIVRARPDDDPLRYSAKFGDMATRAASVVSSPHAVALVTDSTAAIVYEASPHWRTLNVARV